MAVTEDGDKLEGYFNRYTEIFKEGMHIQYFLLAVRYLNPASLNTDAFLREAVRTKATLEKNYEDNFESFYGNFKEVETGVNFTPNTIPKTFDDKKFIKNMVINGPVAIQKKADLLGVNPKDLSLKDLEDSFNSLAGGASQDSLAAPRANQMSRIQKDPQVKQFYRKANTGACNFCQMLSSRGPVYKKNTVKFQSHGNCACSPVAVFKGYTVSKESQDAADRWIRQNKGKENKIIRENNVKEQVAAGYLKPKTSTYLDIRSGLEKERTVYVKTQKGKDRDLARKIEGSDSFKKAKFNPNKPKNASEFNKYADSDSVNKAVNRFKDRVSDQLELPTLTKMKNHKEWAKMNGVLDPTLYPQNI